MSRKLQRESGCEKGFTLLELLVAMAVLGLVMTLIGSTGRLLRETGDKLALRRDEGAELALVTTLLHERLGDAVALDFGQPGRPVASFSGNSDRVRFLTLGRSLEPSAPLVLMSINTVAEGGLELERAEIGASETSFAALETAGRFETRTLARSLGNVSIQYFGRRAGRPTSDWYDSWEEEPLLPQAVRFNLSETTDALPPIVVPIHQTHHSLCPSPQAPSTCVRS
jgi:general secretion pathway protein J